MFGETRWAWAMLAASFVLAGPVLTSRFNIDPHGIGLYICRRFHVLPAILLAVPVAAALDGVCARITRPRVATALTVVGFAALLFVALPRVLRVHSPAMELGVRNLLRSLPPAAIVVVISEDQCFGGRYLQLTRGERPDVAFVCSELLRRDWYRAGWAGRGLAMPFDAGAGLRDVLLRTGRPVFVDRALTGMLDGAPSYPFGVVSRLLPPMAQPPSPAEIAVVNRDLFQAFDLDYARPYKEDDFAAAAHRRYIGCWAAVAGLLDAVGDHEGARDAVEVARSLQPIQEAGPGW